MRTEIYNYAKKILLSLFALMPLLSRAQRPLPKMWVDASNSAIRESDFMNQKFMGSRVKEDILSDVLGFRHPTSYTYTLNTFDKLISLIGKNDGVRVYFASYDQTSAPPDVKSFMEPSIKNKQTVLVFAPTRLVAGGNPNNASSYKDEGSYYVLSLNDYSPHFISNTIKIDWIKYFIDNFNIGLSSTVEGAQENNMGGIPSDTRDIHYLMADFIDFFQTEINYQSSWTTVHPQRIPIDSIQINFASYPNTGIGPNKLGIDEDWFKNRLILNFEFIVNKKVFFFETTIDFGDRFAVSTEKLKKEMPKIKDLISAVKGGDNGQLCPPYCQH